MERRIVTVGAIGGAAGALVMAMFAMIAAATYQHTGFFTPLYHIASPIIGTDTMMRSMGTTYFSAGPALLGLVVHMIVGIVFGVVFALGASRLGVRGAAAAPIGVVYGVAVMLFMAYVGLPITAAVLRGGDMVSDMATLVGWGTFTAEHAIYGLVLGAIWAVAGVTVARAPSSAHVHA
ncbi:MAG: hypothetical protein H0W27_01390 [Actinobacteria bacterium]|nr:hypothetical protein [Actinomycetota bacterium]